MDYEQLSVIVTLADGVQVLVKVLDDGAAVLVDTRPSVTAGWRPNRNVEIRREGIRHGRA